MLEMYLPKRYQAAKAHVVDSHGNFSEQIDVVVFDRQYSPFIFTYENQTIIPAESVYAVFEAKQTVDAALVAYAQEKVASVRRLHRTSLPIPHAGGVYPPKPLIPILGGLLTFESEWSPALGEPFKRRSGRRRRAPARHRLRRLARSLLPRRVGALYNFVNENKPATAFLFKLISRLQFSGTVPMIDIDAYGEWVTK